MATQVHAHTSPGADCTGLEILIIMGNLGVSQIGLTRKEPSLPAKDW